ncbi:MAG: hypothetical protein FJ006_09700 [Chloroflexi bacterium]|nr:hypothetical protein [Chloroflexota bacterium]
MPILPLSDKAPSITWVWGTSCIKFLYQILKKAYYRYDVKYRGSINRPPLANNDSYAIGGGIVLNVHAPGILGNDTDPDGDTLSAVLVRESIKGILTLNADGSFIYIPNDNFSGTDSFIYRANDGLAYSNLARVTITVKPKSALVAV